MNPALRAVLLVPPFTPARLFRGGEQGWWYELASNFEGLYQDSTGVTPVTAVELPVGLQLDKRYGLVRGSELVSNGDFSGGTTGWTAGAGFSTSISVVSGALRVTNGGATSARAVQALTTVVGSMYEVTGTVVGVTGSATGVVGVSNNTDGSSAIGTSGSASGAGSRRFIFRATAMTTYVALYVNSNTLTDTADFDNISVREIPGNHRLQATSASRPTLSARINILLATATLATQSVTTIAASYKLSFTGTGTVTLSGTSTAGPLVGTGANDRVSLTFTPTAGSLTLTVTGSVTLADLRLSADATSTTPIYQRVTTATDYETSGFRLFLRYDGVDDSLATASTVDFSATDKVTVFAGVTKLSDAAAGVLCESSANSGTTAGAFAIFSPPAATATYMFRHRGTVYTADATATGQTAPTSSVLACSGGIADDLNTIRVNGALAATQTADQGAGNLGNHTAYFGRRNNASLPFNGREYANICVGRLASDSEIARAERWVNQRTGAWA